MEFAQLAQVSFHCGHAANRTFQGHGVLFDFPAIASFHVTRQARKKFVKAHVVLADQGQIHAPDIVPADASAQLNQLTHLRIQVLQNREQSD